MMAQYNAGTLDMPTYLHFNLQTLANVKAEKVDIWLDDFVQNVILPRVYLTPLERSKIIELKGS